MNITGKSLIEGTWLVDENQARDHAETFQAFNPEHNCYAGDDFYQASKQLVKRAATVSKQAFIDYRSTTPKQRAAFLNAIADNILAIGDDLIAITMQETALPEQRLQGERMRTVNQLRFFANDLLTNATNEQVEQADPTRSPLPKPKTRLTYLPVGPVAIFGASNFPYAFSVLGGDTASALAAGCCVIVKGHPAHPATSELMAQAALKAITETGMPSGVFSLIQSSLPAISHELVSQAEVKAVGFTGSYHVASELQHTIYQREEVIPFYGELGSINPQVLLPEKLANEGKVMAQTFVSSLMMGQGQFCTSPGLWLIPKESDEFLAEVTSFLSQQSSAPLLTPGILKSYQSTIDEMLGVARVTKVAQNTAAQTFHPIAQVIKTNSTTFLEHKLLQEEVFGPFAIVVEYNNLDDLQCIVEQLAGQLTASIHGTSADIEANYRIVDSLAFNVGRLIFNQMPTGVEVCETMNHGGPFPASTDVRTTSVGLKAKDRFIRPICYQS